MMEAYRHQVGGHSRLMKPEDSSKLYKPFSASEVKFYEKLSALGSTATDSGPLHVLKQFVPKYFGTTEVQFQTTVVPAIHFRARSSLTEEERGEEERGEEERGEEKRGEEKRGEEKKGEEKRGEEERGEEERGEEERGSREGRAEDERNADTEEVRPDGESKDGKESLENEGFRRRRTVIDTGQSSSVMKYMILEDLVYQFKKPCVMDVKMGKRQRKIGASLEKEQRQLEKSFKTTSHAVGFRLCGCQFYDKKNDILCYRDKYWGRKLTKDKLRKSIGQWFWNGYIIYHELLVPLIKNLKILYSCISKLRHYRFWSSSLLWVFDGGLTDANARLRVSSFIHKFNMIFWSYCLCSTIFPMQLSLPACKSLDVRMIDFANTIVLKDNPAPDEEYLFGLSNLISILESLAFTPSSTVPASIPSASLLSKQYGSNSSCSTLRDSPTETEEDDRLCPIDMYKLSRSSRCRDKLRIDHNTDQHEDQSFDQYRHKGSGQRSIGRPSQRKRTSIRDVAQKSQKVQHHGFDSIDNRLEGLSCDDNKILVNEVHSLDRVQSSNAIRQYRPHHHRRRTSKNTSSEPQWSQLLNERRISPLSMKTCGNSTRESSRNIDRLDSSNLVSSNKVCNDLVSKAVERRSHQLHSKFVRRSEEWTSRIDHSIKPRPDNAESRLGHQIMSRSFSAPLLTHSRFRSHFSETEERKVGERYCFPLISFERSAQCPAEASHCCDFEFNDFEIRGGSEEGGESDDDTKNLKDDESVPSDHPLIKKDEMAHIDSRTVLLDNVSIFPSSNVTFSKMISSKVTSSNVKSSKSRWRERFSIVNPYQYPSIVKCEQHNSHCGYHPSRTRAVIEEDQSYNGCHSFQKKSLSAPSLITRVVKQSKPIIISSYNLNTATSSHTSTPGDLTSGIDNSQDSSLMANDENNKIQDSPPSHKREQSRRIGFIIGAQLGHSEPSSDDYSSSSEDTVNQGDVDSDQNSNRRTK